MKWSLAVVERFSNILGIQKHYSLGELPLQLNSFLLNGGALVELEGQYHRAVDLEFRTMCSFINQVT